jgi:hypothetical protein
MAKQYKVTITLTVDEDLKEKILNREDLPNHCWEPTRADQVVVDAVSGFAWDICSDAGLKPKHMNYDIEEVVERPKADYSWIIDQTTAGR